MKKIFHTKKWGAAILSIASAGAFLSTSALAGDVFLTGHDVDLHSAFGGTSGFDKAIVDYLRGGTAAASYQLVVIGTQGTGSAAFNGGANFTGLPSGSAIPLAGTSLAGYGGATFYDASAFAALAPAARTAILAPLLAGGGALEVLSYTGCGGCSLTAAGSAALNGLSAEIATTFNAGMDIWGNSGDGLGTYYNFLPPGAVASGAAISGSSGFAPTADGLLAGFTVAMVDGDPTHNRFTSHAGFTVLETRSTEVISIGLKGGTITDGGIVVGVPDSGMTLSILGLSISGMAIFRRKFRR